MAVVGVIASAFAEAGIIDAERLSTHVLALKERGLQVEVLQDPAQWDLEEKLVSGEIDVYFPLTLHAFAQDRGTTRRRDYNIVSTLERHDAPFVGSGALAQLLVRDKAVVTRQSGLSLPTQVITREQAAHGAFSACDPRITEELVIVKPNDLTSSIGISEESVARRDDAPELARRLFDMAPLTDNVLVQPYHPDSREFSVSVLGNGRHVTVSVLELASKEKSNRHVVYTEFLKRQPSEVRSLTYTSCGDADIRHALEFHARRLFDWFNLTNYARFDFIRIIGDRLHEQGTDR